MKTRLIPPADPDLNGSAPDKAGAALLLVDVINDLTFPGGKRLLRRALPIAKRIARLKRRMKRAGLPTIYANDNFGRWRSDFKRQVEHCLHDGVPGKSVVELLAPQEDDYFVLKPKHSGFYCTALDVLLEHFRAHTLLITGIAADMCVLFTANDAYLRGYRLFVPSDCVASQTTQATERALKQMATTLRADIRPAASLTASTVMRRPKRSADER